MFPPKSWKAATHANAMSAAATAYSESSKPLSSFKNFLNIQSSSRIPEGLRLHFTPAAHPSCCRVNEFVKNYLILPARSLILMPMLVPSSWKAATHANAISAAATAYSESSRPVSSAKNLLIMWLLLFDSIRRCCSSERTNEGEGHL